MIRELRLISITEEGIKAIQKMIDEDNSETGFNKSKAKDMFELKVVTDNPLTYSAKITNKHIDVLVGQSKRMGQFFKIDKEVLVDTFMNSVKSNTILRMSKNGGLLKTNYKIRMIDEDEME